MARADQRPAMPPLAPKRRFHRCPVTTFNYRALANRAVELVNFDRAAAALPEAGQMFRR